MIVGIQPDEIGGESYSNKWKEYLEQQGVTVLLLDLKSPAGFEKATQCNGVMCRWAHNPQDKQSIKRILYTLEQYYHVPVYPSTPTAWHYDEKISQYYLLTALRAPMPDTWLFWEKNQAFEAADHFHYPMVFKLTGGAGAANVIKVENKQEAFKLIWRAFEKGIFPYTFNEFTRQAGLPRSLIEAKRLAHRVKDAVRYIWRLDSPPLHPVWWRPDFGYAYFQEFLPDNPYDTRIVIIGKRAFAIQRLNRPGDFRASGSGRVIIDPEQIDHRSLELAFQISKQAGFQSMAYDFLYKNSRPVITEMSYTYPHQSYYDCPGHWDDQLTWHPGQMWPEEAQVEDFLQYIHDFNQQSSTIAAI
jgi:glutathione synthase/RimK-type ligase-like ATP-grasp enzyme